MNISEKNRYKVAFKKALDKFTDKLEKYVSTENGDSVTLYLCFQRKIYHLSLTNIA